MLLLNSEITKNTTMFMVGCDCCVVIERSEGSIAQCRHGRTFQLIWEEENGYILHNVTRRPLVVCLCGSTRFSKAFQDANLSETLGGNIVLTVGCETQSDGDLFADMPPGELEALKEHFDILHYRKIDLADEVLILNVGGYIGESTARELEYARNLGKRIRFLEDNNNV